MILVDNRVGSAFTSSRGRKFDLFAAISERVNGEAELARLGSADFAFEGSGPEGDVTIGIERKAIGDMLGSMRTGRYAGGQAREMSETYDICYLLVEGLWRPNKDGVLEQHTGREWKPFTLAAKGPQSRQLFMDSELDKHLCSMELKKNVIVVRSGSHIETVQRVVNRYNWWQKPWHEHSSTDPIKVQAGISFTKISVLRQVAAQLPGVGWTRSAAVEKHFGTIENMATALSSEWAQIDGIGAKLAVKLYGVMRGR